MYRARSSAFFLLELLFYFEQILHIVFLPLFLPIPQLPTHITSLALTSQI